MNAPDLHLSHLRASYRAGYDARRRGRLHVGLVLIALALALAVACLVESVSADPAPRVMPVLEPSDADRVAAALSHWSRLAPRNPLRVKAYRAEVAEAIAAGAAAHGLPVEVVTAITCRESSGRQDARGTHGEIGLMQVHPSTAIAYRCRLDTPARQVDCGCRVLARHLARCGTIEGALAAYGSRGAKCRPKPGGGVDRMVRNRMRLAAELRGAMETR